MSAPTRVEVAIVGAGFAGIGAAIALRRAGRDDIVILERAASVGGTWRDNTYPGVACDVPAHLYGFATHPNPAWSRTFAKGAEIHAYLERVVDDETLRDRLRLRTPLRSAEWDAARSLWCLRTGPAGGPATDAEHDLEADVLVLACGRLTEPTIPRIAGLEHFPGPVFHSARWDHTADLAGARVGVVGTGASAVQIVPELARTAAHVTLFQRTPAWIVPRGGDTYSETERERFVADPAALEALRADLYAEGEERFASRSGDSAAAAEAEAVARAHLERQIADPVLRAALTPDYAFGCKRVLLSDDFYPALASGTVTLVPEALTGVAGSMLVAADGTTHEVDALVLATGFASSRQPYAELVVGEHGRSLAEHWSEGMTAFASTVVSGFPNLFVLNGPNASLGHSSAVLMIEEQAQYLTRVLERRGDRVLHVDPVAERTYTDEISRAAASTRWMTGGCRNWYVDERSGRLTLLWPGTVDAFRARLARADGSEFLPSPDRSPARPSPRTRSRRELRMTLTSNQAQPLRFGYKASAEQFGPTELLEYAVLAEEVGFDSVFVSDHLQPWLHEGGHAPASVPWLGALGAKTSRVLIGTSVLTPTFRYNPTVVAQDFATLGVMYPGRVILGVGTGEALNEANLGIAWPDPPERFQRLKEAIGLIRRLWSEDRVTFDGTYYTARNITIYDKLPEPVPIYIGAAGPAATRLAGRIADGFITTSGKTRELYTETLLPALQEGLEKAGRAPDAIDTLMEIKVSLDETVEAAKEKTRFWAPLALTPDEKMGVDDPIEMQRLGEELPIERAASRFIVSDDPDEHVERISWYIDLGFRHLVFHDPGHDQEAFLRRYGDEILPRLRAKYGA